MENMHWKEKAEDFLRSHLNDDNYNAEEAAVYFLSRRENNKDISKVIDMSIQRWREDKTRWSEECRRDPTKAASSLRLMQWGEIVVLQKYRDSIFQNFGMPYSHDFYPDDQHFGGYLGNTSAFFPLLFPLFTSDIAVNQMGSKLISLLHLWQGHLNDLFMRKELFVYSIDKSGHSNQAYATLISAYIFAACRLGRAGIDLQILDKSIQYLLDSQQNSGLWGYDQTTPDSEEDDLGDYCLGAFMNSSKHVVLGTMGIHAVFLANPKGSERSIKKAVEWLLRQQQSDGAWYQHNSPKYPHPVHTTVLALDAIEMAEGGGKLTFDPNMQLESKQKDDSDIITKASDLSIDEKIHTIIYQGKKIRIGGAGATWEFFTLLYKKRGEVVPLEELRDSIRIYDINKIKYDLVRSLIDKGAEELAEKIKSLHSVGYYLDI